MCPNMEHQKKITGWTHTFRHNNNKRQYRRQIVGDLMKDGGSIG